MRVIVFFDLPTETLDNKASYRKFHKYLIRKGFIMMQESVYSKLALNQTVASGIIQSLKKNAPSDGLVQILTITEKQFEKIEYLVGSKRTDILDTDERLVII